MTKVAINGNITELKSPYLIEYLNEKDINIDNIIILLNDDIIKKEKFKEIILKDNDKIEIVKFVGGG